MQETWSEQPKAIRTEIQNLIQAQTPLSFCQRGQPARQLFASAIQRRPEGVLLLLEKVCAFQTTADPGLALYLPAGQAMRGFAATPSQETSARLTVPLPRKIIQVQRRRHQRFPVAPRSQIIFSRQGSQAVLNAIILDLSQEGARICGRLPENLGPDVALTSLTMILRLGVGNHEEIVFLAEAWVKRSRKRANGEIELGIHFQADGQEQHQLEVFLNLLRLQGNVSP